MVYVTTWDGISHAPARPLRVHVDGEPVTMERASAHQLSLTRDHLLVFNSNLVQLRTALVDLPLYVKVAETGVMAGSFLRRALQQLLER